MRRRNVANYEAALLRKSIVDNDDQLMKLFPVITVLLYCEHSGVSTMLRIKKLVSKCKGWSVAVEVNRNMERKPLPAAEKIAANCRQLPNYSHYPRSWTKTPAQSFLCTSLRFASTVGAPG
jgi:hypothetical protein